MQIQYSIVFLLIASVCQAYKWPKFSGWSRQQKEPSQPTRAEIDEAYREIFDDQSVIPKHTENIETNEEQNMQEQNVDWDIVFASVYPSEFEIESELEHIAAKPVKIHDYLLAGGVAANVFGLQIAMSPKKVFKFDSMIMSMPKFFEQQKSEQTMGGRFWKGLTKPARVRDPLSKLTDIVDSNKIDKLALSEAAQKFARFLTSMAASYSSSQLDLVSFAQKSFELMTATNQGPIFAAGIAQLVSEQLEEASVYYAKSNGRFMNNRMKLRLKQLGYQFSQNIFLTKNVRFFKVYGAAYSSNTDKRYKRFAKYIWSWIRNNLRQVIRQGIKLAVAQAEVDGKLPELLTAMQIFGDKLDDQVNEYDVKQDFKSIKHVMESIYEALSSQRSTIAPQSRQLEYEMAEGLQNVAAEKIDDQPADSIIDQDIGKNSASLTVGKNSQASGRVHSHLYPFFQKHVGSMSRFARGSSYTQLPQSQNDAPQSEVSDQDDEDLYNQPAVTEVGQDNDADQILPAENQTENDADGEIGNQPADVNDQEGQDLFGTQQQEQVSSTDIVNYETESARRARELYELREEAANNYRYSGWYM